MGSDSARGGRLEGKRKFALALLVIVISAMMVFAKLMESGGWITIATLALGLYGAGNIIDKKFGGAG